MTDSGFLLEEGLVEYSKNLGIDAVHADYICPPDYKYSYHWNRSRKRTDDVIHKRMYSTDLVDDKDIRAFIADLSSGGLQTIKYRYFDSRDALNDDRRDNLSILHFEAQYEYFANKNIGQIITHSDTSGGRVIQNSDGTETVEPFGSYDTLSIPRKDLVSLGDEDLWVLLMWVIADGQKLEKNFNIGPWRQADALDLNVSMQRFSTGTSVIAYDTFNYEVRDRILRDFKKYLEHHSKANKSPVRLTIIVEDDKSESGKKAFEFIDSNASPELLNLETRFTEYCYELMNRNLESFNEAYESLVSSIDADRQLLAKHILADDKFIELSDSIESSLRTEYLDKLLESTEFKKCVKCFQLTDNNDWLERKYFIDDLARRGRESHVRVMKATPNQSKEVVRLNGILDTLLSRVKPSTGLMAHLYDHASFGAISKHEKEENKLREMCTSNPEKARDEAYKLLNSGYYTISLFTIIARSYREQEKFKEEFQFLFKIKNDYNINDLDSRLRRAAKLLEKSGEPIEA